MAVAPLYRMAPYFATAPRTSGIVGIAADTRKTNKKGTAEETASPFFHGKKTISAAGLEPPINHSNVTKNLSGLFPLKSEVPFFKATLMAYK
ncbi:MAG: hypothetical protein JEZ11_02755 [Desulfobacterales bacterium]|nr:hypothetical protein [Desulfobacterales bacterium]